MRKSRGTAKAAKKKQKQETNEDEDELDYIEGEEGNNRKKKIENIHLDDHEKEKYAHLMFSKDPQKKDRYKVKLSLNKKRPLKSAKLTVQKSSGLSLLTTMSILKTSLR
jgi:hypothetical protein